MLLVLGIAGNLEDHVGKLSSSLAGLFASNDQYDRYTLDGNIYILIWADDMDGFQAYGRGVFDGFWWVFYTGIYDKLIR